MSNLPSTPLTTEQLLAYAETVKGFLHKEEGMTLYSYAQQAHKLGPCLEVGTYCGKSAVYIAAACKETDNTLFCVDHHRGSWENQPGSPYHDPHILDPQTHLVDTLPILRSTLHQAGLEHCAIPIVGSSHTVAQYWGRALGLIFIDAAHSYEDVKQDVEVWTPHIAIGGYLIMHDLYPDVTTGGQGPIDLYRELITHGPFQAASPAAHTLGILRRVK